MYVAPVLLGFMYVGPPWDSCTWVRQRTCEVLSKVLLARFLTLRSPLDALSRNRRLCHGLWPRKHRRLEVVVRPVFSKECLRVGLLRSIENYVDRRAGVSPVGRPRAPRGLLVRWWGRRVFARWAPVGFSWAPCLLDVCCGVSLAGRPPAPRGRLARRAGTRGVRLVGVPGRPRGRPQSLRHTDGAA